MVSAEKGREGKLLGPARCFGEVLIALTVALAVGCLERRSEEPSQPLDGCTACHGDPSRAGDALARAAPPGDLFGSREISYPGVGAHDIHLLPSRTHGGVACQECHVVPERTDSPGHADDAAPAEIVFGSIARRGSLEPSYDPIARSCDASYCHGGARAVWTEPRSSEDACGTCHGLPPAAPHTSSTACASCHGEVIDEAGRFRAPELHVNGKVELRAQSCTDCHGQGDEPAPPRDTLGSSSIASIGVGAHAAHLSGGRSSRAVACSECHQVPTEPEDFAHADGLPAEVAFTGPAQTADRAPVWERVSTTCVDSWCHGPGATRAAPSPSWTEQVSLDCDSCHGMPPASPHPQLATCSSCHDQVVDADDRTIIAPERHVDGVVDVSPERGCTSCHGDRNAAPPRALNGATESSEPGVGAHQIHLAGSARARAVPCAECHLVPERVLSPGHVDSFAPVEVVFSGAATAFGATPRYADGKCSDTACHGAVFPRGHASGGSLLEPRWTQVDGSQGACGSCHALPPPRPHPYYAQDCGRCHENMTPDGSRFIRPELHVDGIVTFELGEWGATPAP